MADFPDIEELYEQYVELGWRIVWRILGCEAETREEVLDVLQDAWTRVIRLRNGIQRGELRAYPKGNASCPEWKWFLSCIFRSTALDFLRQRGHVPQTLSLDESSIDFLPSRAASPSDSIESEELWRGFLQILSPQQQIVSLLLREGHTISDIAEMTGQTKEAVYMTKSRMLKKFRAYQHSEDVRSDDR